MNEESPDHCCLFFEHEQQQTSARSVVVVRVIMPPKWGGFPAPFFEVRPSIIAGTSFSLAIFQRTRRRGTMSFLQLAHKSLKAPAVNPVARLYRSVNK